MLISGKRDICTCDSPPDNNAARQERVGQLTWSPKAALTAKQVAGGNRSSTLVLAHAGQAWHRFRFEGQQNRRHIVCTETSNSTRDSSQRLLYYAHVVVDKPSIAHHALATADRLRPPAHHPPDQHFRSDCDHRAGECAPGYIDANHATRLTAEHSYGSSTRSSRRRNRSRRPRAINSAAKS